MQQVAVWRANDDARRAWRKQERVIHSPNDDRRHDLCPGIDVVRLVRHASGEDNENGHTKASREKEHGMAQVFCFAKDRYSVSEIIALIVSRALPSNRLLT